MAVVLCLACAWYSLRRRHYLILFVSYIVVHKKTFILVMFRVLGLSVENNSNLKEKGGKALSCLKYRTFNKRTLITFPSLDLCSEFKCIYLLRQVIFPISHSPTMGLLQSQSWIQNVWSHCLLAICTSFLYHEEKKNIIHALLLILSHWIVLLILPLQACIIFFIPLTEILCLGICHQWVKMFKF